jgi:hypothetical protein
VVTVVLNGLQRGGLPLALLILSEVVNVTGHNPNEAVNISYGIAALNQRMGTRC